MAVTKRAYKFRFYPTDEQARNLAQTFGCVRFVYNWALNKRKRAYIDEGRKLYTKDLSAAITDLKREKGTMWLKEVSSVPLQQALRHLDDAYKRFFKHLGGYPTFKKRHDGQSATYVGEAFRYKAGQLTLAKQSEPLSIHWSRHLPKDARPTSVTVSRDKLNRYFVSILIGNPV